MPSERRRRELKDFVLNALTHKNTRLEYMYHDNAEFLEIFAIEKMNFTLDNLNISLQTIASYLFKPGEEYKTCNVDALLLYSMKLDEYLTRIYEDYQTLFLVEILVKILIKIDYIVSKIYCNIL